MVGKRILLVDDDVDITKLYKRALEEDEEFKVDAYNDPIEALSDFRPDSYDVLLIDVMMPKMNGFELCKEIKNLDETARVCFITGFEVNYKALREIFPGLAKESYISN